MFRCLDCYKEYEVHPGYCDECGSDQFEEVPDNVGQATIVNDGQYDNRQYNDGYTDGYADEYADDGYYDDGQNYQQNGAYVETGYAQSYSDNGEYGYQEEYQEEYVPPVKLKKKKKKKKKPKKQTMSVKIGIGVFALCIVLSICAFIFIGAGKEYADNSGAQKDRVKDYTIPTSINAIWDSTPPKAAPSAASVHPSKILNTKLDSIDEELRNYVMNIAREMTEAWVKDGIQGDGITQIEFIVNKQGKLVGKKIYKFSGNKSLDDSIGRLINDYTDYQTPPSSYNEEVIILSFKSNDGALTAFIPKMSAK